MTVDEKEALMLYLEARLLDLCSMAEQHWHDGCISLMYSDMYDVLADIDSSIDGHIALEIASSSKKST